MNESRSISKNISLLYRLGQTYFDTQLSPYHIGSGQQFFLLDIHTNSGLSQNDLRAQVLFDKSTITRSLQKLEELHYIKRVTDKQDKRILRLYITEEAKPVIEATKLSIIQWLDMITADMNEEEKKQTEILLEKMAVNAQNVVSKKGTKQNDTINDTK